MISLKTAKAVFSVFSLREALFVIAAFYTVSLSFYAQATIKISALGMIKGGDFFGAIKILTTQRNRYFDQNTVFLEQL